MRRLPDGLSQLLRNQGHGAIDHNLMFFVEDDCDRFIINFNDKTNELRVNCDAFTTPAFCQKREAIYHPVSPLIIGAKHRMEVGAERTIVKGLPKRGSPHTWQRLANYFLQSFSI